LVSSIFHRFSFKFLYNESIKLVLDFSLLNHNLSNNQVQFTNSLNHVFQLLKDFNNSSFLSFQKDSSEVKTSLISGLSLNFLFSKIFGVILAEIASPESKTNQLSSFHNLSNCLIFSNTETFIFSACSLFRLGVNNIFLISSYHWFAQDTLASLCKIQFING
jgi:hypothetical protein